MKCPECDGTGKVVHPMMTMNGDEYTGEWEQYECEMCGGAGVIQGQAPCLVSCCPACDGKGFIKQTNEEWRKTCSTEEFAEWMFDIIEFCLNYENYPDKNKYKDLMKTKEDIKMWLKQPHTPR